MRALRSTCYLPDLWTYTVNTVATYPEWDTQRERESDADEEPRDDGQSPAAATQTRSRVVISCINQSLITCRLLLSVKITNNEYFTYLICRIWVRWRSWRSYCNRLFEESVHTAEWLISTRMRSKSKLEKQFIKQCLFFTKPVFTAAGGHAPWIRGSVLNAIEHIDCLLYWSILLYWSMSHWPIMTYCIAASLVG